MSRSHLSTALADLTPQHGYDAALETGENPFARFGGLDDQGWLDALRRSISEPTIDGVEFPGFPQAELQRRIHGTFGADALVSFIQDNGSADDALPDTWFDVAVGYSVFSHLSETSARHWVAVLNRAVRPGGWCVLTTYGHRFMTWLSEAGSDDRAW